MYTQEQLDQAVAAVTPEDAIMTRLAQNADLPTLTAEEAEETVNDCGDTYRFFVIPIKRLDNGAAIIEDANRTKHGMPRSFWRKSNMKN